MPVVTNAQAGVDPEWVSAYEFMRDNGLTSATTYEGFAPLNGITREQLAAFASRYYKNVLKKTEKDGTARCSFTDATSFDPTLVTAITEACEFGLMGVGITAFNPKGQVTRGEVLTVMSRMLFGSEHNGGTPFWANHETALFNAGIVKTRHPQSNANGSMNRIFTALMMMRAANDMDMGDDDIDCTDPLMAIFCEEDGTDNGTGTTMPENPETPTGTGYDNTDRPVSNGNLTLTATSKLPNGASIPNNGVVTFANMQLAAQGDDVTVYGIKVGRIGLGQRSEIKRVFFEVDGKRISSYSALNPDNTSEITFNQPIVLKAGSNAKMDFVVELESTQAGGEHAFEVLAIDTNAKGIVWVGLKTNTYRTTTYQTVTVKFEGLSTTGNYSAGETTNLKFGQFRMTNQSSSNEDKDVMVKAITLRNDGDGDASRNLTNIKLVQNGKVVSKEVVHDGRNMTILLDNYLLKANQTPVFEIIADVAYVDNTNGDTYRFRVQRTQDVIANEVATDFRATIEFAGTNGADLFPVTVRGWDIMLRNLEDFNRSVTAVMGAKQVALARGEIQARQSVMLENAKNVALKITTSTGWVVSNKIDMEKVIQRIELKIGSRSIVWVLKNGGLVDFDGTFTIQALQPIEVLIDIKSTAGSDFRNAVVELPNGLGLSAFDIAEYTANGNTVTTGLVGALASAKVTIQDAGLSMARTDGFPVSRNVVDGATNVEIFRATITNTADLPVNITQLVFAKLSGSTYNGDIVATIQGSGFSRSLTIKNTDTNLDFNSLNINVAKGSPVTISMRADFEAGVTKIGTVAFRLANFLGQDVNGTVYNKDNAANMLSFQSATINVINSAATSSVNTHANNRANFVANSSQQVTLWAFDVSASQGQVRLRDLVVIGSNGLGTVYTGTALDDLISNISLVRADGTVVAQGARISLTSNAASTVIWFSSWSIVPWFRFENLQNVAIADGTTETFQIRATVNSINSGAFTNRGLQMHIPGAIIVNGNAMNGIVLEQSNGTSIPFAQYSSSFTQNQLEIGRMNTVVQGYPVVAKATYTPNGVESLRMNVTATNGRILITGLNLQSTISSWSLNGKIYVNSINANNVVYSGTLNGSVSFTAIPAHPANTTLGTEQGYSLNAWTTATFILVFDTALGKDQTRTIRITDVTYEDVIGGQPSNFNITINGKENVGELPVTETFTN